MNRKHLAVIGNNVEDFSLSPKIHQQWLDFYNMNYSYRAINVQDLQSFFKEHKELNFYNVTSPFKSLIIPYLDEIDIIAKNTNSVNVVKKIKNKLHGYNTDYLAIKKYLKKFSFDHKSIMIFGNGSITNNLILFIQKHSVKKIYIVSRNEKNQTDLISYLSYKQYLLKAKDIDFFFNTTPRNSIVFDKQLYNSKKKQIFIDFNYGCSTFLNNVNKKLHLTLDGIEPLIIQAQLSFKIWFDINPDINLIKL